MIRLVSQHTSMGPIMQAVDKAMRETAEACHLLYSNIEMGGALTKVVGEYLIDLLARYEHRSTDLRMTIVVVANWGMGGGI